MALNPNLKERACTLVFQESERDAPGTIFLFAKWKQSEQLSLFVNPGWRSFVSHAHHEYIEDLLRDFIERRIFDPEGLFQQLSCLSVGPILTSKVNDSNESHCDIPNGFVELASNQAS